MARIDWAVVCDLAFFDRQERLCLIGMARRISVPRLPLVLGQLMLVARLAEVKPVEEFEVSMAVVTPTGQWTTPTNPHGVSIVMSGEYVLVTLRDLPLMEEGVYRFQVGLTGQAPVSVEMSLLTARRPIPAGVH